MEVVMPSPVQECSLMENGAPKLTKSQRKNRRKALKKKLNASLGSLEKREDAKNTKRKPEIQKYTISPTSVQDNPNIGIGTSATGDKNMAIPSPAASRDEKSSDSKGNEHTKVANSMTTNLNLDVSVQQKMQTETGIGTTSIGDPASKKRKRKSKKMKNNNPDSGAVFTTCESTQEGLSSIEFLEVKSGETVLAKPASPDANMVLNGDHTQDANGKMGGNETTNLNVNGANKKKRKKKLKNKQPTLGELLNPHDFRNLETAKGETGSGTTSTHNPASKKRERDKVNKNPELGEIVSTHESTQEVLNITNVLEVKRGETANSDANIVSKVDHTEVANDKEKTRKLPTLGEIYHLQYLQNLETASRKQKRQKLNKNPHSGDILSIHEGVQEGLTTKVLEVQSDETVSGKTATSDANMVSKGVDHTERDTIKLQENETKNLNVNGKGKKKKKKPKSKNKGPNLDESLNPQHLNSLEAAKNEAGSGTTATDNPTSKMQKTREINYNPALGDMLTTCENTQHNAIATKDASTSRVMEAGSCEKVSREEEHMKDAANSEMCSTATVLKSAEPADLEIVKAKAKSALVRKSQTLWVKEITPVATSKKQKTQEINYNPALGDMLSTCENTQHNAIATKDASTSRVMEAGSCEKVSREEEHMKDAANSEMCSTTTVLKSAEPADLEIVKAKAKSALVRKSQMLWVKEITPVATSKKQKTQEINYNPPSGDMLSTCENTQDNAIAKKDLSTSVVLEAVSGEKVSRGEEHMKDATNSVMGSTTIVLKSAEPADLELVKAKANSALARQSQTLWVKEITPVATSGKKLLIFDVNGLLADVVSPRPKDVKADIYLLSGKAIFKRPYLDDFLTFCFEKFNVGIWCSRKSKNLLPLVKFLLRGLKTKLLFLWDGSKCTNSGVKTRKVKNKHVVVKDLRKFWDKDGPCKRWVKGTFHESNTLLVDDSPFKALLNPKHTGIFPATYSYKNRDDNFLAPNGELQTYLEGLAAADDVKTYVAQHPFGQSAIDEQRPDWAFYSNVLERLNRATI